LIPKVLTLTGGQRHFLFENSLQGSVMSSFGLLRGGHTAGRPARRRSRTISMRKTSGARNRGSSTARIFTWHIMPDVMVLLHWSQGFRPGGFVRMEARDISTGRTASCNTCCRAHGSDKLTNNEIGWKTEFFDHRFQWNGAVYRENWDNVQISFFDPGLWATCSSIQTADFLVKGIETSIVARVVGGLTVQGRPPGIKLDRRIRRR